MTGHGRVVNKNNRSLQRKRSKAFFHKWDTNTQKSSKSNSNRTLPSAKDPAKAARLLDKNKTRITLHHTITAIVVITVLLGSLYYILF